jgi:hypothetical protein
MGAPRAAKARCSSGAAGPPNRPAALGRPPPTAGERLGRGRPRHRAHLGREILVGHQPRPDRRRAGRFSTSATHRSSTQVSDRRPSPATPTFIEATFTGDASSSRRPSPARMAPRARRKADRRPIYSAAAPPSSMGRSSPSTRTACRTWPPGRTGPRPGRRIHGRDRPRPGRPGLHAQTSTYQPGRGAPDWIKRPVALTQEVVPIGWQPGEGRRAGLIGSILFAVHDREGVLRYAGHVGTGFTPKPRYAISPATSCARHRRATRRRRHLPRASPRRPLAPPRTRRRSPIPQLDTPTTDSAAPADAGHRPDKDPKDVQRP